jgi:drug/metabolite transporter (DMT)-like permease
MRSGSEPPRPEGRPGLWYMAAGAFFFAVMSLLVRLAGARLPAHQIVLARAVVSLALTWGGLVRAGVSPLGRQRRLLLLRGGFGFGALVCFYYALVHLPLADATVIQYTNPVFTALFAAWFLAERMGRREVAAVVASMGGVLLVARPGFLAGGAALPALPVAVALAGAVLSGAAYTTVRRLAQTEHPLVIIWYFAALSTVASLPLLVLEAVAPTPVEWVLLAGVGLTTQLGQVSITKGLALERAGPALAVAYLQIVFAAALGWGVLRETPDLWTGVGAFLVVASTLLLARRRRGA